MNKNFFCSGKKGDLHMLLYIVKAMGGGNLFIGEGEFEEPLEIVLESCEKLIRYQKYINRFDIYRGESIDINLDVFRESPLLFRKTLLEVLAKSVGLEIPNTVEAWIDAPIHQSFKNKVIFHRRLSLTKERVNYLFDWQSIINYLGAENCVFVSRLESEYESFGFPEVAYYKPIDNFEHASIIKSARLFIGNQSFPSALADALDTFRIFELSYGADRKHFAIRYSDKAWYYANDIVSTFKNFKYVIDRKSKKFLNIRNFNESITQLSTHFHFGNYLLNEMRFHSKYFPQVIKNILKNKVAHKKPPKLNWALQISQNKSA